jgi:hypothetical protein
LSNNLLVGNADAQKETNWGQMSRIDGVLACTDFALHDSEIASNIAKKKS